MKPRITIVTRRLPPSLNKYIRLHWRYRAALQEEWDDLLYIEWIRLNKFVCAKPIRLTYDLYFKNNNQRDYDNYQGGAKVVNDALKKTFILRDDHRWLIGSTFNFHVNQEEEKTVITIEEV